MSKAGKALLIAVSFLFLTSPSLAQSIGGVVLSEQNEPIPFASVFVESLSKGTSTDQEGRYYLNMGFGDFDVLFSSVGYESKTVSFAIGDDHLERNIYLKPSNLELENITIKASKKDPAYEIIQKVIDNRPKFRAALQSFKSNVYIKAIEEVEILSQRRSENLTIEDDAISLTFGKPKTMATPDEREDLNLLEMQVELSYQSPNRYKEKQVGYQLFGRKDGLFIPRFSQTSFNFYHNQVPLTGLGEIPAISPISRTAILTYKYRLIAADTIDDQIVYEIKVTPRKKGNATVSGIIHVNEGIWNLRKIDLSFSPDGLNFFDSFRLKQEYRKIDKNVWFADRQDFFYSTKQSKRKGFSGQTLIYHTEIEPNASFPEKFFGDEVSSISTKAMERDSAYWEETRKDTLTYKEIATIHYRDSIKLALNDPTYLDSMDLIYNKLTFPELVIEGIGLRNSREEQYLYLAPILGLIQYEILGGFRLGPYAFAGKRWKNGKNAGLNVNLNMGLKNADLNGRLGGHLMYDPFRLGVVRFSIDKSFYNIFPNDAFLNQLDRSSYIVGKHLGVSNRIELFNGFYFGAGFDFTNRSSADYLDTETKLADVVNDSAPISFDTYQSLITDFEISYTYKQKYHREPNRKVVLGSKFPAISLRYKKGWNGLMSSDIDFDYLELGLDQRAVLGTIGTSIYKLAFGKFLNTDGLEFIDYKRFRKSDPYLFSESLDAFQSLDTTLYTTDLFLEGHWTHHFNGALVNNIPLVKKLKIRAVAGGGFLWIKETGYRREEFHLGVERIFKLGARRRLRIGVHGVLDNSNQSKLGTNLKFSFDVIDTWKRQWAF